MTVQTEEAKWEQDIITWERKRKCSSAKWDVRKRAPAQISLNWQILRKRIAAGTATFLVKVKAHRGESVNEGADILANNAISDRKVGKEWCQQTNRAVFTWKKPCREAGKIMIKIIIRHLIIA